MPYQVLKKSDLESGRSKLGNPWRTDEWSITAQGKFFSKYGPETAIKFAKLAGTHLYGPKPKTNDQPIEITQNFLIRKGVTTSTSSGGGGQGTSGSGPPS